MSIRNFEALMAPRSIVVVGASDRAGSVGATVWRNVRSGMFTGAIRAVNPSHSLLDGEHVFASLADLPAVPDLAIVCVPPEAVVETIEALGRTGTKAAIVMTGGLSAEQKTGILVAARPHLLRLLGSSCMGILAPHLGMNASFAHTDALPGELAFVTQSGALLSAVLDWSKSRRIGFSHMVALGDHLDVDAGDMLDYLASDPKTRAILLYLESIESPRKFMSAARAAARNKPVIVVKAGRARPGPRTAVAATGAVAGSDAVVDAAIRRAGMLRVDTLDELFLAAETLARFHGHADAGLTLLTNAGGAGVIAADAAARVGLALPALPPATLSALGACLPPNWSHGNPVDIVGDAPVQRYVDAMRLLLDDPATGALLFMHAPTAAVRSEDIAHACVPTAREASDRMLTCWLGDASVAEARRIFEDAGLACYSTPEEAVRALEMIAIHRRNQALLQETPTASEAPAPDLDAARGIVARAIAQGRDVLDEVEAKALLAAYGIAVVATRLALPTAEAAVAAAREIGFPVALKIRRAEPGHRSDLGGVELNLRNASAVHDAALQMMAHFEEHCPQDRLEGFSVQAMVRRPHARALVVGASLDPAFGPVLLFGEGGAAVDVLADRAVALPPLNRVLAREMISRTRVARLLAGYGDRPPAKIDAVCDVLIAVAQMQADLPELHELDINPLWADEQGPIVLDARVRLLAASGRATDRFAILPYPAALVETTTWEGREIVLRPVRPEDLPLHDAFLAQVTREDLRMRFFGSRRELPRSELARMVQIDYAREMSFLAIGRTADGNEELLGLVRAVCDPDNVDAEFGILVRSDLKAHGLGTVLMRKVVDYLRSNATRRLVGDVLQDNAPMRALMDDCGFAIVPAPYETGVVRFVLELQGAAPVPPPGTRETVA
jgi:acetyltransferase